MRVKIKEFDLENWVLQQRANWHSKMADRAVRRYKKFKGWS